MFFILLSFFLLFISYTIKPIIKIIIIATIKMQKFIHTSRGNTLIIWSVTGLNPQLVFPGNAIKWKVMNRLSKSIIPQTVNTENIAPIPMIEYIPGEKCLNFKFNILYFWRINITSIYIPDIARHKNLKQENYHIQKMVNHILRIVKDCFHLISYV